MFCGMAALFRRTELHFEIENPGAYQAALYIRLSKEDENEGPSQSVTNQQSLLKEFVRQQGLSVWDTYIDDGWSGTSFDRPAFRRMIGDIEAGCEASLNPARLFPIVREAVE